jgi:hypothetical protein
MDFSDIPTIVSAYRCNRCGELFEIPKTVEERVYLMDHFRMPVVELPVGLVLLRPDEKGDKYFMINYLIRMEQDHNSIYRPSEFDPNAGKSGMTRVLQSAHAVMIINQVSLGYLRGLSTEEQTLFSKRYAAKLAEEIELPEFVLDPRQVPAFVERGLA